MLALAVGAICALAVVQRSSTASPQDKIVIHGAHSGSHLKLNVRGNTLVVDGYMSRTRPTGCRFTRVRLRAACRLADITAIKVGMGPKGDKVEVLDRLPTRLIAHLGGGSDKFVGNDERDFCSPQGASRNRCIGGGGNDVCITGPRNTDCVGGPGDDYCRANTGSDGCWGGPGRDVCYMGPGHDGCHGDRGRDRLFGGASSDRLYGGAGLDYCSGGPGRGRSRACETGPRR
jgi:hypothetical protein